MHGLSCDPESLASQPRFPVQALLAAPHPQPRCSATVLPAALAARNCHPKAGGMSCTTPPHPGAFRAIQGKYT